jgi:hypothetical protein
MNASASSGRRISTIPALVRITGISCVSGAARNSRDTSTPVRKGIITSSRARSGAHARAVCRASSPSTPVITVKPDRISAQEGLPGDAVVEVHHGVGHRCPALHHVSGVVTCAEATSVSMTLLSALAT